MALRTAQVALADSNAALAAYHRAAVDRAIDQAPDAEAARREVARINTALEPLWTAYDAARAAWIGTDATVRAVRLAELAGQEPDPAVLRDALLALVVAYERFRRAAISIGALAPPRGTP
jgi:hypothetical protein